MDGCEILRQMKTVVNIPLFLGFQPFAHSPIAVAGRQGSDPKASANSQTPADRDGCFKRDSHYKQGLFI